MNSNNSIDLVQKFIEKFGEDTLYEVLNRKLSPSKEILTIIGNAGIHIIPEEFLHGEIFIASSGNINLKTSETIVEEYEKILTKTAKKLRENSWKKVYFVPTGHPTLSLQIKLIVYQVLRINTIDLFYLNGDYVELYIDHRKLLDKK